MQLIFKVLHFLCAVLVVVSGVVVVVSLFAMIWMKDPFDLSPFQLFATAIITIIISGFAMNFIDDNYIKL